MQCKDPDMRRGIYILLAVFLVQLTGLEVICVPSHAPTHACCPRGPQSPPSGSSSLPDCCLSSILNCQGSSTEVPTASAADSTAPSVTISHPMVWPMKFPDSLISKVVSPSMSPPPTPFS